MRSIEGFGAASWVNRNFLVAYHTQLDRVDLDAQFESSEKRHNAIADFCRRADIDRDQLLELGREAKNSGGTNKTAYKYYEMVSNVSVPVFRSSTVRPDCLEIDGTVPRFESDESARYQHGPRWKNNSCMVDALLFVCVMLDVGRTRVDQLSPAQLGQLPVTPRLLRMIVLSDWGQMEEPRRNELRDLFMKTLERREGSTIRWGEFLAVDEVCGPSLEGLPQLSFTTCVAHLCCDGIPRLNVQRNKPVLHTGWSSMSNKDEFSIEEMVNTWFTQKKSRWPSNINCTRGDDCTAEESEIQMVLDRLPPVLVLFLPSQVRKPGNKSWKLFEEIEITYRDTNGQQTVRYRPIGCIVRKNENHFTVRWVGKGNQLGEIVEYDSLNAKPKTSVIDNWWSKIGAKSKTGMSVLFYSRVWE